MVLVQDLILDRQFRLMEMHPRNRNPDHVHAAPQYQKVQEVIEHQNLDQDQNQIQDPDLLVKVLIILVLPLQLVSMVFKLILQNVSNEKLH